jgi:5-methylcytosine-specific restriction endonuclease McrA
MSGYATLTRPTRLKIYKGVAVGDERDSNPKSTLDTLWSGGVITEEAIRKRLDEVFAHRKDQEGIKKQRGWRNKCDPLSLEYEDYRKTKLWKTIKCRVMIRDNHHCQRCGGAAELIHHICYDDLVMLGQDDSKLIALCSGCHELVHYKNTGEKRNSAEQITALTDMELNEKMPKVDLRLSRRQPKMWSRLTSVQKREWNDEFNRRKMESISKRRMG